MKKRYGNRQNMMEVFVAFAVPQLFLGLMFKRLTFWRKAPVDIERIELHTVACAAGALCGIERGAAAEKSIEHEIAAARAIEDRNPGEKTMRSRSGSPAMRG